jgi:hypothetical protein
VRSCDHHRVLERVRVVEIVVQRDKDQLAVEQELLEDDGMASIYRHLIECDSIMYARPTVFELADVTPVEPVVKIERDDSWAKGLSRFQVTILEEAVRSIAIVRELTGGPTALAETIKTRQAAPWVLHMSLWTLYELTDLSPRDCCVAVGYASPQPFHTMRLNLIHDEELKSQVRRVKGTVAARLGLRVASRKHSV